MTALGYWINWLPEEVVEAQFCIVPPIMRDEQRIESTVRQIVGMEHRIQRGIELVKAVTNPDPDCLLSLLDQDFPPNFHSCLWPFKCSSWDLCYTSGVVESPVDSGLFLPRIDHHKSVDSLEG